MLWSDWRPDPWQLLAALALDLLLGDPRHWPHLTRLAGFLSTVCEKTVTPLLGRNVGAGLLFWLLIAGTMLALYAAIYRLCFAVHPSLASAWNVLVIYQSIAAADLAKHVRAILAPLRSGDLTMARQRLSWIVGRDTDALDEAGVSRAAIESVAESLVDAVLAPLFWATLAGAPGALLYRVANTLDSTVGHRTEVYEKFGKVSARIDDALNWLPARLGAAVFCLVCPVLRYGAIRVEAARHASPNAGWGEAAMARAVGVRLGGDNVYDGLRVAGPIFNAEGRVPSPADIEASLLWFWRVVGVCAAASLLALS